MSPRRHRARATVAAFSIPIAALLLSACGDSKEERERKARETAFVQEISTGNVAKVAAMLEADPGLVTAVDESGGKFVRPLHEAIRMGNVPLVRLLLDKGVNPNAPEANGVTPLHQWVEAEAKEEVKDEILDVLVFRRADLEAADNAGERPLHVAARRFKAASAVELLLQKGASRESHNRRSRTPLLEAAAGRDFRSAVPLCAWGADLKARDTDGKDVLALAAAGTGTRKDRDQAVRFFGPGGGCARLVAYHETQGPAPAPVREAAVEENDCAFGDLYACGELGMRYDQGNGVATDLGKAVTLFEKACNGGAQWSCGKLGYRLEMGRGVVKDVLRAMALYEKACQAGESWCCANAGVLLEDGLEVPKDEPRAASYYDEACRGGHMGSCVWLGRMAAKGRGIPKDVDRARQLFRKACDGKEPDGCKGLAALAR